MGRRGGGRGSKVDEFHRPGDNHRLSADTFNIPEHSEGGTAGLLAGTKARDSETSEDILAKYRKKPGDDKVDGGEIGILNQRDEEDLFDPSEKIDRENFETSFVFQDARRKLRLVLSEVRTR